MLGLIIILLLGVYLIIYRPKQVFEKNEDDEEMAVLGKYWQDAYNSLKNKKYLRAEKALLNILRIDERNAAAYNRLGILYAKKGTYQEAIECFEIAQSLETNPSNLHNVGLIYYNVGDFSKAALAFEQAIAAEDNVAIRYIAYAKVQEKLGNIDRMTAALEKALELEKTPQTLKLLADVYEQNNQIHLATSLREEAERIIAKQVGQAGPAQTKLHQKRRVIM